MSETFCGYDGGKRYNTYDNFLKKKFGGKCMKIPLDGGFTCPNIDGTKGRGGCIYCSKKHLDVYGKSIYDQFLIQKAKLSSKWDSQMNIPYFQMFTNTYAPIEKLRRLYYEALSLPDVVGMNIATRADALSDDVIELLREISEKTFLTVELGLQTVHEDTAKLINRCHTTKEFLKGYEQLKGLNVCVHIINGLPWETHSMMMETAKFVANISPQSIKIHMLYIEEGTDIAEYYRN